MKKGLGSSGALFAYCLLLIANRLSLPYGLPIPLSGAVMPGGPPPGGAWAEFCEF